MFERFTGDAREIVMFAQDEARALHHPSIGTEHLLLSMLAAGGAGGELLRAHGMSVTSTRHLLADGEPGPDRLDAEALARLGIDLDEVRRATEAQFGPGALRPTSSSRSGATRMPRGHLSFSDAAKKALELALREAVALDADEIGSVHLLLGIVREPDGSGVRLIERAGVDVAALTDQARARAKRRAA